MKIRTMTKQIEKMKEVAGCDVAYFFPTGNYIQFQYFIHFNDEEISAMPLLINQTKFSIITDIKRYFFIRKEVKNHVSNFYNTIHNR